jgi:ATP-dependent Lon protease
MTKAKPGGEQPVEIPDTLPILPLRNSVLFPGAIIPIDVGRRKSVRLVEDAIAKERPVIGILTQKDARTEDPGSGDLYMVGCAARILKVIKLAKDNFSVILQGVSRFEVSTFDGAEPFLSAKVRSVPDPTSSDVELDALVMNLKDIAKRVVKLMPELPKEAGALVDSVTEAGHLADLITSHLELEVGEKQDVLETFDLKTRTRKVLQFLSRQLEVLKVRERINTQVQEEMGRNQREYVLRQQLKAIKGSMTAAATSTSSARRSPRRRCPRRPRRSPRSSSIVSRGCSRRARSTRSRARTSSGSSSCRGRSRPKTTSSSPKCGAASTRITTISTR